VFVTLQEGCWARKMEGSWQLRGTTSQRNGFLQDATYCQNSTCVKRNYTRPPDVFAVQAAKAAHKFNISSLGHLVQTSHPDIVCTIRDGILLAL
jgi:hypothetical protein